MKLLTIRKQIRSLKIPGFPPHAGELDTAPIYGMTDASLECARPRAQQRLRCNRSGFLQDIRINAACCAEDGRTP